MQAMTASVIVVSRHRASALVRCVTALAQQDHPTFEVIVVADPEGIAAVNLLDLGVKAVVFDEANIAAARNIGLAQAAGEVVAFIDDDAVAEPTWLSRLCAPFGDASVTASTGFVRGRNGISFQWAAVQVDASGFDHPMVVDDTQVTLHACHARLAVKTHGTNCAFRTHALRAVGGFDPNFRFFLDEADVNLRMAGLTAIVPLAQVHHGFAASARRRADRTPTDLTDIGASTAYFLRLHSGGNDAVLALHKDAQRRRLIQFMVAGGMMPSDVNRLMTTFDQGVALGKIRALAVMKAVALPTSSYLPLQKPARRQGCAIAGRSWQRAHLLSAAQKLVNQGKIVTIIILSPTALYHRISFDARGFWLHTGGIFGRADRMEPLVQLASFKSRVATAKKRAAMFRMIR